MIPYSALFVPAGVLLLALAALLPVLIRRLCQSDSHPFPLHSHIRARLRISRRILRRLRQSQRIPGSLPSLEALRRMALPLSEELLLWRRKLKQAPSLPAGSRHMPRLISVADAFAASPRHDAVSLARLMDESGQPLSSLERALLPCAAAQAAAMRLNVLLNQLRQDERDHRQARSLAARMAGHPHPLTCLERRTITLSGMDALLTTLRTEQQDALLAAVEDWLDAHGTSSEDVSLSAAERQLRLTASLEEILRCLQALRQMNWLPAVEESDPLHALMTEDPIGIYSRMTITTRLQYRMQAEKLAVLCRMSPSRLTALVVEAAQAAPPDSAEAHIGYYLMTEDGQDALLAAAGLPHRWLLRIFRRYGLLLWRIALLLFSLAAGTAFINAWHPLIVAPFFLIAAGAIPRALKPSRPVALPAMELPALTDELRTLVIMPAVLTDAQQAVAMVRQLSVIRRAMPRVGADCMLLGDFAPGVTMHHSSDAAIINAVNAALSALEDAEAPGRYLYLHRSRALDAKRHTWVPRGGTAGAVESVCRLIAQGECVDELAYSTVSPAFLHRHYAFVLVVPPDTQPLPGMLQQLLAVAAHPLCTRVDTGRGKRGMSMLTAKAVPARSPAPTRASQLGGCHSPVVLLRPDAYLEDTDGLTRPGGRITPVDMALCAREEVSSALTHTPVPASFADWLGGLYRQTLQCWQGTAWQLPFVQTSEGLIRNPLGSRPRFFLRETLRRSLLPLSAVILLLWGAWSQRWWLTGLGILAPELERLLNGRADWRMMTTCTAFLPARAAIQTYAAAKGLLHSFKPADAAQDAPSALLAQIEAWSQGLCATAAAVLSLSGDGFFLPAALLAGLWGCFPLLHAWLDSPAVRAEPLTQADAALLRETAAASWRFMKAQSERHGLPTTFLQTHPRRVVSAVTSPRAIAGWLVCCAVAPEMGLASVPEAAQLLHRAASLLSRLPMPHGLPCRAWRPDTLTAADPAVDAADCGLLLAALSTAAQAARTWLPSLPPALQELPALLDRQAQRIDAGRLYDRDAGLFWRELDADGQGHEHIRHFDDEGLLLSVCACASGMIPAAHFSRLSRISVRTPCGPVPITRTGSAEAWMLPGLFLPMEPGPCQRAAELMRLRGMQGIWGMGRSASRDFTPAMTCRQADFGLPEVAAVPAPLRPVFAPWAAALCLPHLPHEAALSLQHMRQEGLFSPLGFADAIDLSGGEPALCGLYDACHHGMLLCACAHVLADAPLRRLFTALPAVQACLPLLTACQTRPLLPRRPACAMVSARAAASQPPMQADPRRTPAAAHVVGGPDAFALVSAAGSSLLHCGVPLTRFTGSTTEAEGPQFYIIDEGRAYRLNDPFLDGETSFSAGEARFTRLCGSLRATLTILCDPVNDSIIHTLEIVNLSTADRVIGAADCLIPDLGASPCGIETARPEPACLTAVCRRSGRTLFHRIGSAGPLMHLSVCTDETAFTGRSGSLLFPASLDEPIADPPFVPTSRPCLSFRTQLSLSGRGRAVLVFRTGLTDAPVPDTDELPGIAALSAQQGQALAACAPMTRQQAQAAMLLNGALFWRNQPHQGPDQPLTLGTAALAKAGITADQPYAAVLLHSQKGGSLLRDALAALERIRLYGLQAWLCVLCPEEAAEAARRCLTAAQTEWVRLVMQPEEALVHAAAGAASAVLMESAGPLKTQLEAMSRAIPFPARYDAPVPGDLPAEALSHPGGYGGFDPESGDYLIVLPAGMTTPAPWPSPHVSRLIRCNADETGLSSPFGERLHVLAGQTLLSPFDDRLPRTIRHGAGYTRWEACTDQLRITLTAACLPGHAFGLRRLRIRNTANDAAEISLTVTAAPGGGLTSLQCIGSSVFAAHPDRRQNGCLAGVGDGWEAHRASASLMYGAVGIPALSLQDEPRGNIAVLEMHLSIAPGASEEACWIAGFTACSDQTEAAVQSVMAQGASALLRQVRQLWALRLGTITVHTPEDTLDLLLNRILPYQIHCAGKGQSDLVPALTLLAPADARACLLLCAAAPGQDALLPLAAGHYLRITEDQSLLKKRLPGGETLAERLLALLQHETDTEDRTALLKAAAGAEALAETTGQESFRDVHAALTKQLNALVRDDSAEDMPTTEEAAWLAQVYGLTARTRRACSEVWQQLYDQENGVLSASLPAPGSGILPGFPGNGGQDARAAAWFLAALLRLHEDDWAWELLRAMNPIHHTDDPLRSETYRMPPYLLPEGIAAAPGPAGQAAPGDGAHAAAWLWTIAMEQLLGLVRRGNRITLRPRVPRNWDRYTVTLREGTAVWHFTLERGRTETTMDGAVSEEATVDIADDGRVHHVHLPLR